MGISYSGDGPTQGPQLRPVCQPRPQSFTFHTPEELTLRLLLAKAPHLSPEFSCPTSDLGRLAQEGRDGCLEQMFHAVRPIHLSSRYLLSIYLVPGCFRAAALS